MDAVSVAATVLAPPANPVANGGIPSSKLSHLDSVLDSLDPAPSAVSREAIERLAATPSFSASQSDYPPRTIAAVLVLLHVTASGRLAVFLTTRSKNLRSHPGDTAFPGGRVDPVDVSIEAAALREANEEIGLPLSDPHSHYLHLTTLPPLISRFGLVVFPVIHLVVSPPNPSRTLFLRLVPNPSEVDAIFTWPLDAFVDPRSGGGALPPAVPAQEAAYKDEKAVYSFQDFNLGDFLGNSRYRWHSLAHPSMPSPITGFTFDVLLQVSRIAFQTRAVGLRPKRGLFQGEAEGQPSWERLAELALASARKKAAEAAQTKTK